jgi:hypothetical protein
MIHLLGPQNKLRHFNRITKFICQYRKYWKEHVDRMSSDRIPKMILKYQSKGKRNLGRPLIRWKDSVL